jgi:hypothetical protein
MILVEPLKVYISRARPPATVVRAPIADLVDQHTARPGGNPQPLSDSFWTDLIVETLREGDGEPVPITTLVNSVARQGNFSKRADYDRKRVELFKVVGRLIRTGRLDRVGRKHVTIAPPDAQQQPCAKAAAQPLNLPPPRL